MGKTIEVILLEDVAELGRSGDACRVRSGYARNYLFPKKQAVVMTPGTKRLIEKKRAEAAVRLAKLASDGIELTKKQLVMHDALKALGDHEVALHLHPEVRGVLKVKVVAEKVAEESAAAE